jgi:hypothetical protein
MGFGRVIKYTKRLIEYDVFRNGWEANDEITLDGGGGGR